MANITGGVKITGFISPTDTTDTYAVIDPVYGVDGFRNVDSTADRDNITSERRRGGMIVGVKNGSFNDYYILNSGNTTWSQIQMVTGFTWDGGSYDLTLNTFGGGITKNLSLLASDVTVTGGTYNSTNGIVTFSSNTTNNRTGLYYAGNWSASSAYTANTVVTYTVNSLDYYSISNVGPIATPPTGDTATWRPISSRGVFSVSGFTSGYTNIYTTAATYTQTSGEIALSFTDPSKNFSITGVTSIYGKDDSIKSNRLVDLNQKTLNFSSSTAPNSLTITTGGTVGVGVLSTGTTKLHISAATDPIRIEGIAASSDSNVLTIDTSGVVHTISVASLSSTLTTLYTGNGTLNSDRTVDLSNKTLNFSSSTNPNTLVLSGGNIGIGTSTPQFPLHVVASASTLRHEYDVAGGAFSISGNTGIPRFDIGSNAGDVFSFGVVATGTAATWASRGKAKDAFVRASAASNGLNIINAAGVTGEEDYIRFYAGKNADQGLPDLHINGSGATRGFVGIGVSAATNILHISATTNPVKIEGLTAVSATTKIVATNANNELVNFSGTNRSIPYFTTAGVITHSPTFTYNDSNARTLQIDDGADLNRSSTITFAGGRGNIICPSTAESGLILQVGLTNPFDPSKSIILRNGSANNYVAFTTGGSVGGNSAQTATFNSIVSINSTGITTSNWGLNGIAFRVLSNSYADSTTSPTTTSETVASSFARPTFTASVGKTYSALTNVYIAGAPIAGTNVTGLTSYALRVNTGTTYFGGDVTLSGISTGTTSQLLTRESNGNVSFRNLGDVGVISSGNTTLYWYDENNTPPSVRPVATGSGSIAFGDGATALANNMFVFGGLAGQSATSATSAVFMGRQAGSGATFADYSTFIGEDAGKGATSADTSFFVGYKAGENSSSSRNSIFIGQYAGQSAVTDSGGIIMLGHNAGQATNNATYAVGIGFQAADSVTNGRQGVFIGYQAGQNSIFTSSSVIIGGSAGNGATGITNMTAVMIGPQAGRLAHRSTNSVFIGNLAGETSTGSDTAVFIGSAAGRLATGATQSIFIGQQAGSLTNNVTSIFIGAGAGYQARSANASVMIGLNSGQIATGATNSIFIGDSAGDSARSASQSIMIGNGAGLSAFTSTNSVLLGYRSGFNASGATATTGLVLLGHQSGYQLLSSSNVVSIGKDAGYQLTGSNQSIMIGQQAGYLASNVTQAVIIGALAGQSVTAGTASVFIGYQAGSSASQSVFIGDNAGQNAIGAGVSNFIGSNAGLNARSSTNSTFIGQYAGQSASGTTQSIMIGNFVGASATNGTNSIFIGNRAGSGLTSTDGNIIIGHGITMSANSINRICIGGVIFGVNAYNSTTGVITSAVTNGAVSIGAIEPNSSAILDLTSTSKGFLPPRMTATQASAVSLPAEGLMIYVTSTNGTFTSVGWWGYGGSPVQWRQIG